jgi:hypothetical protein
MLAALAKEFRSAPVKTSAALASLLGVLVAMVLAILSHDVGVLAKPSAIVVSVGIASAAVSLVLSHLAPRSHAGASSYVLSFLLAELSLSVTGVAANLLLRDEIVRGSINVGGVVESYWTIAGISLDAYVCAMSSIVALIFAATALARIERASRLDRERLITVSAWVAAVVLSGGAILKAIVLAS